MIFQGAKIFNNRPRNFLNGGSVKKTGFMTKKQLNNDSINAVLQVGELVIPKKYVNTVSNFLKSKNIDLPNM